MGRPPKYSSAEQIEPIIEEYFAKCEQDDIPFTMSGLGNALGMDRWGIVNYSKRDEFHGTIKRARSRCEQYLEERLIQGKANIVGCIFALKNNHGWKDVHEQNFGISGDLEKVLACLPSNLQLAIMAKIGAPGGEIPEKT